MIEQRLKTVKKAEELYTEEKPIQANWVQMANDDCCVKQYRERLPYIRPDGEIGYNMWTDWQDVEVKA